MSVVRGAFVKNNTNIKGFLIFLFSTILLHVAGAEKGEGKINVYAVETTRTIGKLGSLNA